MRHQHLAYRADLDGLRAVAILPVLFFHVGFGIFSGGFVGVDVFFVLSGFFMAKIIVRDLEQGSFSFWEFYVRRMRRIFPALFTMLALSSIAAWFLFMPKEFTYFADSLTAATLFVSNILFRRETGYFDIASDFKPLLHTWSLSVEEQFYLVFPVALFLCYRYRPRHLLRVTLAFAAASFIASAIFVFQKPDNAFYLLHFRVWELLIGVCVALLPEPNYPARTARMLTAGGLAAIAFAVFAYTPDTLFPGPAAAVPCLGAALVIHARSRDGIASRLLDNPLSVFIGRISYSLYLWHWPLIVFTRYVWSDARETSGALAITAMCFVAAYVSWRWVEQPIRNRRLVRSGAAAAAASLAFIAVAVGFGLFVKQSEGVPRRLPEEAWAFYKATYDVSPFSSPHCFADSDGKGLSLNRIRDGDLCRVGATRPQQPQFLIWGDSHAASIAPAIDAAALQAGVSGLFVGRGSCPPLPDAEFGSRSSIARCADHSSAVMHLIAEKKFPFVVMAAYWPKYVHRSELPNQGHTFDSTIMPSTEDFSLPVKDSLIRTMETLKKQGTRTVLVMDVPEMGYDVPEALARAVLYRTSMHIAPPLTYTMRRQALARRTIEEAARSTGSLVIDPLSEFCDAVRCHAVKNDTVLYRDSNHLSSAGALRLTSLFTPMMKTIGGGHGRDVAMPGS